MIISHKMHTVDNNKALLIIMLQKKPWYLDEQ